MHLYIKDNNNFISCFYSESIAGLTKAIYQIDTNNNNKYSAILYCYEKKICCDELILLKELLLKSNIKISNIYSSSRESVITAKSLKINGIFQKNFERFNSKIEEKPQNKDLTHLGIVRSGDQISSNGNLFIIGDVNPGAKISAKKNIYVWGKLCGVAFAGQNGNEDSTISSLYLHALQLRINDTVAIGPKEKPKNNYPEIALLERGKIIIKPLIINS